MRRKHNIRGMERGMLEASSVTRPNPASGKPANKPNPVAAKAKARRKVTRQKYGRY